MLDTFVMGGVSDGRHCCKVDEHEYGEDDKMQTSQGFGQSVVFFGGSAKTVSRSNGRSTARPGANGTRPLFRLRQPDGVKLDTFVERR